MAASRYLDESEVSSISPITQVVFAVQAGEPYTFHTQDLVPLGAQHADTALHLFEEEGSPGHFEPWGSNDECDDPALQVLHNSCLTYTASSSVDVLVLVHAASRSTPSTGTLVIETPSGPISYPSERFGGHVLELGAGEISWLNQDVLHAVEVNDGLEAGAALMALLASAPPPACNVNNVRALALGMQGPFGSSVLAPVDSFLLCRGYLLVGSLPSTPPGAGTPLDQSARVLVHDVQLADSDSDGLGDLLEQAMGTCAINDGSCAWSPNSMDSDHDGLPDGEEAIGYLDATTGEAIPFAYLGASPLKKDVFIELDWAIDGVTLPLEPQTVHEVAERLSNDPSGWANNPDGTPGMDLHIDTGVPCSDPATCGTLYGAWGGAEPAEWFPSFEILDMVDDELSPARKGRSRWGLVRNTNGGQTWDNWIMEIGQDQFNGIDSHEFSSTTHEIGHAVGLEHGGHTKFQCKPNYPSLMNYLYFFDHGWVTQAEWDAEATFSDGQRALLDGAALDETLGFGVVDPLFTGLDEAGTFVGSNIANFNDELTTAPSPLVVDWNRSGAIDPGTVVASPISLDTPSTNDCDWPFGSDADVVDVEVTGRVAVAKRGGSLVATFPGPEASSPPGDLHVVDLQSMLSPCQGGQTQGCCPVDDTALPIDPCVTWSTAAPLSPTVAPLKAEGFATATFDLAGLGVGERVVLVYVGIEPQISSAARYYARYLDPSGGGLSDPPFLVAPFAPTTSEHGISLLVVDSTLHVFFKHWVAGTGVNLGRIVLDQSLAAGPVELVLEEGADPIRVEYAPALASKPGEPGTAYVLATTDTQDKELRLFSVDGASATATALDGGALLAGSPLTGAASGTALGYDDLHEPNRWFAYYICDPGAFANCPAIGLRQLRSLPGAGDVAFGYDQSLDAYSGGVSWPALIEHGGAWHLLFESSKDLLHITHPDGTYPARIHDVKDFELMCERMCQRLLAPTGNCDLCVAPGDTCDPTTNETLSCSL